MPVFSSVLSDAKESLQTQTRRTHREVCIPFAGISISIARYRTRPIIIRAITPSITPRDNSVFACHLRAPFDAATQRCYD